MPEKGRTSLLCIYTTIHYFQKISRETTKNLWRNRRFALRRGYPSVLQRDTLGVFIASRPQSIFLRLLEKRANHL
jgi:hypothetical protein